jgi:hypothetical protein
MNWHTDIVYWRSLFPPISTKALYADILPFAIAQGNIFGLKGQPVVKSVYIQAPMNYFLNIQQSKLWHWRSPDIPIYAYFTTDLDPKRLKDVILEYLLYELTYWYCVLKVIISTNINKGNNMKLAIFKTLRISVISIIQNNSIFIIIYTTSFYVL